MKIISPTNLTTIKSTDLVTLECEHCGTPFLKKKGKVLRSIRYPEKCGNSRFCSNECRGLNQRTGQNIACQNCGKIVYKSKRDLRGKHTFCSQSCSASWNNRLNPKRKCHLPSCCFCSKQVCKKTSKYCIDHLPDRSFNTNRTIAEVEKQTTFRSGQYAAIRDHARRFARQNGLLDCCKVCGYSVYVEACHIKDIGDLPKDTPIHKVNSLDNLIGLCANHHIEFDRFLMKDDDEKKLFSGLPEQLYHDYIYSKNDRNKK